MTVLNVIEKRQKSCFLPSGFFSGIIVAKSKVTIHSKIQSLFQFRSDFFLDFQHHDCSECQEIAIFSYLYKIYCRSDLPRKFRACCHFQLSQIFKYMPCQVKKFISSRVPKLLCFGAAIISPVTRATSKIRKRSSSPYSLL